MGPGRHAWHLTVRPPEGRSVGRGYRVTTAGLYLAAVAASELFTDYSWPLDALDRADWNDAVKTHRLNWPDS